MRLSIFGAAFMLICVVALVPVHADQPFIKDFGCYKDSAWQAHCRVVIGIAGLNGPTAVNVVMTEYVDGRVWNSHTFAYVTNTWAYTAIDIFGLNGLSLGEHQIYAIANVQMNSGIPSPPILLSGQSPTTTISVG